VRAGDEGSEAAAARRVRGKDKWRNLYRQDRARVLRQDKAVG
jgi:hypothetical protein